MAKTPAAVTLGRRGGRARARLPAAELSRIGKLGGRPSRYHLTANGRLWWRTEDSWTPLMPPYDAAARAYLRRHHSATR